MGSGSGIIAKECLKYSNEVTAVDIEKEVIDHLGKIKDLKVIQSDLFFNVTGQFDIIFFNPPYLPKENPNDISLDGGKHGYEIILRFLNQARNHLNKHGKIILLFSSHSNKEVILREIKRLEYKFKQIGKENLFFESLYVYEIKNE